MARQAVAPDLKAGVLRSAPDVLAALAKHPLLKLAIEQLLKT